MAAYKIAALQKALDDSVSSSDLEKANKQHTELTVKYRDMLQRDGRLVQRTTNLEHLEVWKFSSTSNFSYVWLCNLNEHNVYLFPLSERERFPSRANFGLKQRTGDLKGETEYFRASMGQRQWKW